VHEHQTGWHVIYCVGVEDGCGRSMGGVGEEKKDKTRRIAWDWQVKDGSGERDAAGNNRENNT